MRSQAPIAKTLASQWAGAALLAAVSPVLAQLPPALPAFPGADGAGYAATGGRGGVVYHVTRLDGEINCNRTVPGTLAYGLNDANFRDANNNIIPRTIVFDVGGTIWLGRKGENVGWDTQDPLSAGSLNNNSSITIAGQTAPGGITIMGGGLKLNGNNIILRNLTIAPGYGGRRYNSVTGNADQYTYDALNLAGKNLMIDHVTAIFATDETISADERASHVTIQYSNISLGQNYAQADAEASGTVYTGHALGSLLQMGSNAQLSVHHNLYAHLKGRLPRVGTESSKLTTPGVGAQNDFRNNVFYNWLGTAGSGASGQPGSSNFIANFFLAGPGGLDPAGGADPTLISKPGGTSIFNGSDATNTKIFHAGNLKDTNKDGDFLDGVALSNADFGSSSFQSAANGVPYFGFVESANAARDRVLDFAGANWQWRGPIDQRVVQEVRSGTGRIEAYYDPTHGTEWNALLAERPINGVAPRSRPANFDSDADGMPDTWELAHGLNPALPDNNSDFDGDGYTNLEHYLNELAATPAPQDLVFSNSLGNGRYANIQNWTTGIYQPTRFDTALIPAGTVTVDAPGQHAENLGLSSGATLSVTAGSLDVAADMAVAGSVVQVGGLVRTGWAIAIGPGAQYTLAGGTLSATLLQKHPAGGFSFTGGVLHAKEVAFPLVMERGTLAPGSSEPVQQLLAAAFPGRNGLTPTIEPLIGTTHLQAGLTLNSGTLELQFAAPDAHDRLIVEGPLTTNGGTLALTTIGGFQLPPGVYNLLDFNPATLSLLTAPTLDTSGLALSPVVYVLDTSRLWIDGTLTALTRPGDYNADGYVDAADYTVWADAFGTSNPAADGNRDGVVDAADYTVWADHFGQGIPPNPVGVVGVPEPGIAALLLLVAPAVGRRRR